METTLYILVTKDHQKFKIGLTMDLPSRADTLTRDWGELDLEESYCVTDSPQHIAQLERLLHFVFKKWNSTEDKSLAGYTEWFAIECLPQVIEEIKRIDSIQGASRNLKKGLLPPNSRAARSSIKTSQIANVLFKEYRYRTLRLLFLNPTTSYHVREIARITQVSPGSLHRELRYLADADLIIKTLIGNQVQYKVNTDCSIFDELLGIFQKIQ